MIKEKSTNFFEVKKLVDKLGISYAMAKILLSRGISLEEADKMFNDTTDLFDLESDIYGMNEVAEAILGQKGKNVYVFADYDVDGLSSGFILNDFLSSILGIRSEVYYPDREDGYGLNLSWVDSITSGGRTPTVICVDNGITQFEAVERLKDRGCEVYIIDHHEPVDDMLPKADAICDAWVDRGYGTHLCAAAVVWKVITRVALLSSEFSVEEVNDIVVGYLPFVAIATVSDIMPACPENRAIIHQGLKTINDGYSTTLKALMEAEDIESMRTKDIAWTIAPGLNACSRMGHIEVASKLLSKEGILDNEVKGLALDVRSLNRRRKTLTEKAIQEISVESRHSKSPVVFADLTDYPVGIIGIIAGKIAETTGKPAIAYQTSPSGEDIATGSARAPEGISIKDIVNYEAGKGNAVAALGHAEACGVTIVPSKIREFNSDVKENLVTLVPEVAAGEEKKEAIEIDAVITPDDITSKLRREINSFGYTPKEIPSIGMLNVKVEPVPWCTSSGKRHVLFRMEDSNGKPKYAVRWNGLDEYESMGSPRRMSFYGSLDNGSFCRYCKDVSLSEHSTMLTLDYMEAAPAIA